MGALKILLKVVGLFEFILSAFMIILYGLCDELIYQTSCQTDTIKDCLTKNFISFKCCQNSYIHQLH